MLRMASKTRDAHSAVTIPKLRDCCEDVDVVAAEVLPPSIIPPSISIDDDDEDDDDDDDKE